VHNFTSTQPVGTTQQSIGVVPVNKRKSASAPQKQPVKVVNLLDVLAGIVNRNKPGGSHPSKQKPPKSGLKNK